MRTDPGYPPENLNKFSMYIACSWKTDSCQYLFRRNSFKVPFIFTFARITRLIIFVCKLVSLVTSPAYSFPFANCCCPSLCQVTAEISTTNQADGDTKCM